MLNNNIYLFKYIIIKIIYKSISYFIKKLYTYYIFYNKKTQMLLSFFI